MIFVAAIAALTHCHLKAGGGRSAAEQRFRLCPLWTWKAWFALTERDPIPFGRMKLRRKQLLTLAPKL